MQLCIYLTISLNYAAKLTGCTLELAINSHKHAIKHNATYVAHRVPHGKGTLNCWQKRNHQNYVTIAIATVDLKLTS
jgi:hypothetical protein